MARYIGPVCKLCRREGMKLFLKGERCYTDKCAFNRRPYPPGQHGQGRIKLDRVRPPPAREAEGAPHLRRARASVPRLLRRGRPHTRACTGEKMLGLARAPPRQRRATAWASPPRAPSAPARAPQARLGQRQARQHPVVPASSRATRSRFARPAARIARVQPRSRPPSVASVPSWLELDKGDFAGTVKSMPVREEITLPIHEQFIVEFYSR